MKEMTALFASPISLAPSRLLIFSQWSRISSGVGIVFPSLRIAPAPVRIAARL